jgi:hypothetical protein
MSALAFLLAVLILSTMIGPRQAGRFIAKIRIGYRAQLRDEGEA